MKKVSVAALAGIIAVGAVTACELEEEEGYRPAPRPASTPRSQEATPRPQPKRAASVSGVGVQTKQMTLSRATYVCTSTVENNIVRGRYDTWAENFAVIFHGDFGYRDSNLIANVGMESSGSWDAVVKPDGGTYLVEVRYAATNARWTVSCR